MYGGVPQPPTSRDGPKRPETAMEKTEEKSKGEKLGRFASDQRRPRHTRVGVLDPETEPVRLLSFGHSVDGENHTGIMTGRLGVRPTTGVWARIIATADAEEWLRNLVMHGGVLDEEFRRRALAVDQPQPQPAPMPHLQSPQPHLHSELEPKPEPEEQSALLLRHRLRLLLRLRSVHAPRRSPSGYAPAARRCCCRSLASRPCGSRSTRRRVRPGWVRRSRSSGGLAAQALMGTVNTLESNLQ